MPQLTVWREQQLYAVRHQLVNIRGYLVLLDWLNSKLHCNVSTVHYHLIQNKNNLKNKPEPQLHSGSKSTRWRTSSEQPSLFTSQFSWMVVLVVSRCKLTIFNSVKMDKLSVVWSRAFNQWQNGKKSLKLSVPQSNLTLTSFVVTVEFPSALMIPKQL